MGPLLQTVEASHQKDRGEKNRECDHEAVESFIVKVVRSIRRLDRHLVCHVVEILLRQPVAHLLQPASVVKNNKDIIVDFFFGKEDRVIAAPFFYLLVDDACLAHEIAHFHLQMLRPHRRCLDVAMVIVIRVKDEDVELGIGEEAKFGG